MFQRQYRGAPLDSGAQVLAHGNVSFYEQAGRIQLIVDFVQPAGVGARQAEFERLKEKLAGEGLVRRRPEATAGALSVAHRCGHVPDRSGVPRHLPRAGAPVAAR